MSKLHEPPLENAREQIHVLLADDNEEWVEFVAEGLEEYDDSLRVTTALNANEAMLTLRDDETIECVVADYGMPEIDGLQLLERVRDEHPELPFLLVTGQGTEDIASRAIREGVTDYIQKSPRLNQTALFANRIRTSVEQYRFQQAAAESEKRYRSVVENSRDAILAVRDGRLLFANDRLSELTGLSRGDLRGEDVVERVVHPEDRDGVRAAIADWSDGTEERHPREARLVTADGAVRHCEYTGGRITLDGEPGALLSIRDVTQRQTRQRQLEWERQLNRTVRETLVEARSREDIEQAIASQLSALGYDLVWIGERVGWELEPRVVEGDETYVESIDRSFDDGASDSEPSVWAVRSREPQFLDDIRELFSTSWREAAIQRGYRTGGAIPLVYNDMLYGVLAVFTSDPDQLDETERELLIDLAETVAFAIHSIETETALAGDRAVQATLEIDGEGSYLSDVVSAVSPAGDVRVRVQGTLPYDSEQLLQYVTFEGDHERFLDALSSHPEVTDVTEIDATGGSRLQITTTQETPEYLLASYGADVIESRVTPTQLLVDVELGSKQRLRRAVERIGEQHGSVSVMTVVESDSSESESKTGSVSEESEELTEKQATALRAAFHHGYFEQPRASSASEIAESLGVAHSTFLQHLRAAQQKVFGSRFHQ